MDVPACKLAICFDSRFDSSVYTGGVWAKKPEPLPFQQRPGSAGGPTSIVPDPLEATRDERSAVDVCTRRWLRGSPTATQTYGGLASSLGPRRQAPGQKRN